MNPTPSLHGKGFLLLANGDRYAAHYSLHRALAPIPKVREHSENRRYRGVSERAGYDDLVIPAAARLQLEDGVLLPFRSCDTTTEPGVFEVQTRVIAETTLN
jgi:hypothetical protein